MYIFEPQHAISGADDEFLRYAFIIPLIKHTAAHRRAKRAEEKRCQKKKMRRQQLL
jgi:hypothetical protein